MNRPKLVWVGVLAFMALGTAQSAQAQVAGLNFRLHGGIAAHGRSGTTATLSRLCGGGAAAAGCGAGALLRAIPTRLMILNSSAPRRNEKI